MNQEEREREMPASCNNASCACPSRIVKDSATATTQKVSFPSSVRRFVSISDRRRRAANQTSSVRRLNSKSRRDADAAVIPLDSIRKYCLWSRFAAVTALATFTLRRRERQSAWQICILAFSTVVIERQRLSKTHLKHNEIRRTPIIQALWKRSENAFF